MRQESGYLGAIPAASASALAGSWSQERAYSETQGSARKHAILTYDLTARPNTCLLWYSFYVTSFVGGADIF